MGHVGVFRRKECRACWQDKKAVKREGKEMTNHRLRSEQKEDGGE